MTEIDENVAKIWLQKKMNEFMDLFDPNEPKDEYYMNAYQDSEDVLDKFYNFVFKDSIEKEKRRQLYEELKKEFGE